MNLNAATLIKLFKKCFLGITFFLAASHDYKALFCGSPVKKLSLKWLRAADAVYQKQEMDFWIVKTLPVVGCFKRVLFPCLFEMKIRLVFPTKAIDFVTRFWLRNYFKADHCDLGSIVM